MTAFDYYVSGIKLGHQVPRFEATALESGREIPVKLNDWLQSYRVSVLIFQDLKEVTPLLSENTLKDVKIAYVSKLPIDILKTLHTKDACVISDEPLTIIESYGARDERTGHILPTIVVVGASGQCVAHVASEAIKSLNNDQVKRLLDALLPH